METPPPPQSSPALYSVSHHHAWTLQLTHTVCVRVHSYMRAHVCVDGVGLHIPFASSLTKWFFSFTTWTRAWLIFFFFFFYFVALIRNRNPKHNSFVDVCVCVHVIISPIGGMLLILVFTFNNSDGSFDKRSFFLLPLHCNVRTAEPPFLSKHKGAS